jgi:hypothetical protein
MAEVICVGRDGAVGPRSPEELDQPRFEVVAGYLWIRGGGCVRHPGAATVDTTDGNNSQGPMTPTVDVP